jgi:uncharacterized RDD family membrane protein YckC
LSTSPQSVAYENDSPDVPAWKQEINARLVAHRSRRSRGAEDQPALPGMESAATPRSEAARAARVAARVAERYSKVPSYSEMLAAEAANAARAAEAAAKAAQEAHEAAQAVSDVLWSGQNESFGEFAPEAQAEMIAVAEPAPVPQPIQYRIHPDSLPEPRVTLPRQAESVRPRTAEIFDAFEDAVVSPAQPLPVRVLEFPRELIAARKARPRFAEGPLRDVRPEPEKSQLRIFEVEPEAISHEAISIEATVEQKLPEWHSIHLDAKPSEETAVSRPVQSRPVQDRPAVRTPEARGAAKTGYQSSGRTPEDQPSGKQPASQRHTAEDLGHTSSHATPHSQSPLLDMLPLHVAPIEDRLMAGIVDMALVLSAFLLFVLVFVACTTHPPMGKPALISAGAALLGFFVLYQWLFFNYSESTPGMRYAKIALCTFEDENPTRKALRGRIAALLLSALPLGLGFFWALLDDDRLGWHDRMTRTYQRSYR